MRSVEKHDSEIVNIAELVLPTQDLTQTHWDPAPFPAHGSLLQPAHPPGTHQLCCDTKSVPSCGFSVFREQLGSTP